MKQGMAKHVGEHRQTDDAGLLDGHFLVVQHDGFGGHR
jgi:hypothetical protein